MKASLRLTYQPNNLAIFKPLILLLLTNLTTLSHAQPVNPADKYVDAYKAYLGAGCPLAEDDIRHFVYFARDREDIHDHPFLTVHRLVGAQIMYSWRELEPAKDRYDFSMIKADYDYLKAHGKQLFIQLQDATFSPAYKGVPDYLLSAEYDGGAIPQRNDQGAHEGWVAKRWNPEVRQRFALLMAALGREFDGKIEGINLQESAIGVNRESDSTFSPEGYVEALKANMLSLKSVMHKVSQSSFARKKTCHIFKI